MPNAPPVAASYDHSRDILVDATFTLHEPAIIQEVMSDRKRRSSSK
jgi:hypothetical protein